MAKTIDLSNPLKLREMTGENQATFWRRFGVTQSGGSRYENGSNIPGPLRILLKATVAGFISKEQLEGLAKK